MPGTTPKLALRYPLATEAPDGPGAFLALASDVEKVLGGSTWFPTLAGGSGAALGTNGGSDGSYFQSGKHVSAKGRLAFGSSASFGTGTATISGLPAAIDVQHSTGYGHFLSGSSLIPVFFAPVDGANMAIRPVLSGASGSISTLGAGFNLGTPPQSSQLIFTLDLLLA